MFNMAKNIEMPCLECARWQFLTILKEGGRGWASRGASACILLDRRRISDLALTRSMLLPTSHAPVSSREGLLRVFACPAKAIRSEGTLIWVRGDLWSLSIQ